MKLGYARVSTEDQHVDLQRKRLKEGGCGKLFEEKISGPARQRPALERLLQELRAYDVLVATRLDRLARSTAELHCVSPRSVLRKTRDYSLLRSLWADRLRRQGAWFAGVAEFEWALIRHRTDEGHQAAKRRGVSFRRPQKLRPDQKVLALSLVQEGKSISEVARTFNVQPRYHPSLPKRETGPKISLTTIYRSAQTHEPCSGSVRLMVY